MKNSYMHKLLVVCLIALVMCMSGCKAKTKGKVLVVLSGVDYMTLENGAKHPTGYFLSELMIPLNGLKAENYEVVFANPTGKEPAMDKASDDPQFFKSPEEYTRSVQSHKALKGLKKPRKLSSITDNELNTFSGIFVPGGHAPMEDLYRDEDLGRILKHFHDKKKPTALICHGPIALLSAGGGDAWPYKGYRLTVFSNVEEKIGEDANVFGGKMIFYPENALAKAGGEVKNNDKPWQVNVITDRELITGQNPMSGHAFTEAFIRSLKEKD